MYLKKYIFQEKHLCIYKLILPHFYVILSKSSIIILEYIFYISEEIMMVDGWWLMNKDGFAKKVNFTPLLANFI